MSFESKYVAEPRFVPHLLRRLLATCTADHDHPANRIHSIYFDRPDLQAMAEVDNGDFYKTKVRVRWYESLDGTCSAPFLECKRKMGAQRDKLRQPLPDVDVNLPLHHPAWLSVPQRLRQHGATLPSGLLQPTLHITYLRHRFFEPASALRLAVDHEIRAAAVHPRFAHAAAIAARPAPFAVFEAKGEQRRLPTSLAFVRELGARRRAFSKYGLWNDLLT